ncbi:MAG: hypothetical protein SOR77_01615 [Peptoniphilus sp.]|uniref:hypothetical protein n=1 Tax=Peptoniphilus sp. TaxID=1971214 RepID=UPI002A753BB0|nr:hypothetical protein [Peptoniphilus sp.]MDY2986310.1 hypothetical protein [Peptoniphilus sp.]
MAYLWGKYERKANYRTEKRLASKPYDTRTTLSFPRLGDNPRLFPSGERKDCYELSEGDLIYTDGASFPIFSKGDVVVAKIIRRIGTGRTIDFFVDFYKIEEIREVTGYSQGSYIGDVKSTSRNAYPDNGESGGYWYVYKGIDNQAPSISSSDLDLGSKTENFNVEYIVSDSDSGDTIVVDIFEDTVKKVSAKSISIGIKNVYLVDVANFNLGKHTIRIVAKDKAGATAERTYTFYKSNSAPTISGEDRDLGDKNTAFTETFTVKDSNNDPVSVIVTLNGEEIKNISNAGSEEQSITISTEKLATLELGKQNEIIIRADDGKTGITYRRLTFTRSNQPPIISDTNGDLGVKDKEFTFKYSISDLEKDKISSTTYLDEKVIETNENVTDGKMNTLSIDKNKFVRLSKGKHTIRIVAKDDKGGTSERIKTFTKKVNKLEFILKVNKTDTYAKKVLAILNSMIAEGDVVSIKACNNYSDGNPTWEDITQKALAKLVYQFTNTTKTADTWELAIWVTVTKNSSDDVKSVVRGISGGYE